MPDALEATSTISPARPGAAQALRDALDDPATAWPDVVLRDHQIEALDQLSGRLSNGAMRSWVDAPTGSGKTIMFSAIVAAVGGSALVLVPRRNLAEQTAVAFARFFPSVPVHTDGPEAAGTRGVTITTYQATLRHADKMSWAALDLVICDEAHTALGAQTSRLLDRPKKAVIVGFTATGSTTTGHVEQVFGPVSATLDRASAIDRGILSPLRSLRVERSVDLSDVTIARGDFDQGSLGRALDRAKWHHACAEVWESHFAELGLAGVAYTATVAQAQALADEMAARGVNAAAVSGQTPKRELRRVLTDFGEGKIDVLCNADLLTEGWDETRAAVVMHLAPTTSERVFVQRLGRVMRPAPGKEAVSVEFLPAGEKMGVQTSHEVFGLGWYQPLGRVAGPATNSDERGKLAKAAELLAAQDETGPVLVNSGASAADIVGGLGEGGWRHTDPADLPPTVMEDWVQAAAAETDLKEVTERISEGVSAGAGSAWFALSGLIARDATENRDQPMWRAWAMALLTQPDLRANLPLDVPRRVLDRLRMTSRERLRALWWHADAAGRWDRLSSVEQMGRSGDRRRWGALNEASEWAPAWAWEISRSLADNNRPGRNQEVARIAAWEAHHLISNGGELALIATWLRSAGDPPPDPVPPDGEVSLRLGQAARLLVSLGRDDVPVRSEHIRLAARAAGACGGWAQLRGYLDSIDFTTPDARRSLRAAIGALHPRALHSKRAWNALRNRFPRLPEADVIGVGEGRKRNSSGRRRRRRMRTEEATAGTASTNGARATDTGSTESTNESPPKPRRRRRRRRRSRGNSSTETGQASSEHNGGDPEDAAASDG
ncbi:MAG: DEAD/DEAH box helicase [Thermoleophilia bacterium]|nr:DEAD/DEAH box helicase [Thermoleophilia bacterium]MDH3724470.1 DEAD/DEAH box helicase [Thermoleophilia bacterium]